MAISTFVHAKHGLLISGVAMLAAGGALAGCGSSAATAPNVGSSAPTTAAPPTTVAPSTTAPAQNVAIKIETGKMDGKSGWPQFVPSNIAIQKGADVTLTITNYDDGPAPLPSTLATYETISGGQETVNGTAVTSVPNAQISHTFSVPELGVNVLIPAVPKGQTSVVVTFEFTPQKTGTFVWHCFAPCGDGSDGMSGAMATMGWMEGNVTVS